MCAINALTGVSAGNNGVCDDDKNPPKPFPLQQIKTIMPTARHVDT